MGSLSIGLRARRAVGGDLSDPTSSSAQLLNPHPIKLPSPATLNKESLRDKRFSPAALRKSPRSSRIVAAPSKSTGAGSSSSPDTSARAHFDDSKDRRLAKLRYRAQTAMDLPMLSFYGAQPVALPSRFASIKRKLVAGHQAALQASWARLIAALAEETRAIASRGSDLIPSIDFASIEDAGAVAPFSRALKHCGVGVVRGVVPPADAEAWVAETRRYLDAKHDIKPPPPQDPTCFDFFWTPAQIRARAHPHVLRAMRFAMGFWAGGDDEDRMATRFPISYADRIRIHVPGSGGAGAGVDGGSSGSGGGSEGPIIAQVDGGSLERWEPDGYGRGGTYDSIFRGDWEAYDPWDPAGRVAATPDLYNGAGSCSIFRMFQGLLGLTPVQRGVVRLLPSPKLVTAYFLLRPFFTPKTPAPETREGPAWEAFLAADNWALESESSTVIHGAVPGHAQRVTELWHPHLALQTSLVAPPSLEAGDYLIWHCDTAYVIASGDAAPPAAETPTTASAAGNGSSTGDAPMMVYAPSCPLTQTNALYLARQRKAFVRGHPGPDFDSTGSGLNSEASHVARLGEREIREVGGEAGLRAMGLVAYDVREGEGGGGMEVDGEGEGEGASASRLQAEAELVRLANIILFPDKYEFYMPTRQSTPDAGRS